MKSILPSIIFVLICNLALADGHEDCAMMKGDAIDPEEFSEILGKKVYFCCGTCVKYFDAAPAYYIKALPALGKLFNDAEKKQLGVDKVELLGADTARFIRNVVSPESKTVEYKGKKVFGHRAPSADGLAIRTNTRKPWTEVTFHNTSNLVPYLSPKGPVTGRAFSLVPNHQNSSSLSTTAKSTPSDKKRPPHPNRKDYFAQAPCGRK